MKKQVIITPLLGDFQQGFRQVKIEVSGIEINETIYFNQSLALEKNYKKWQEKYKELSEKYKALENYKHEIRNQKTSPIPNKYS